MALSLFLVCFALASAIDLPSHLASSMVFQRNAPIHLWGTDMKGATVTATLHGVDYRATADASGRFDVTLPPLPASAVPFSITLSSSVSPSLVLSDLLAGDVFVSSGQSNMELTVSWCYNYSAVVARAGALGPMLRIAQVALLQDYYNVTTPQTNLTMNIPWARASSQNVAGMSAIAYFTAVEMLVRRPHVPVGTIATSWGGTAMEPWMPKDALEACGEGGRTVNRHNPDPGLYSPGVHPEIELLEGVPQEHSTLWNSMVAPLLSLSVSGFYWYQGESNAGNPEPFKKCFPAMISSWRKHFNSSAHTRTPADVPFVFFQLAPWPAQDNGVIPTMREAQLPALALPKVGMVVAADKGDTAGAFHPIHPPVKEELSRRAALIVDNLVYGNKSSPVQGPTAISATMHRWTPAWGDYHYGTGAGSYVCHPGSGFLCAGVTVKFDQDVVIASLYGDLNSYPNGLLLWDKAMKVFQRASLTGLVPGDPSIVQLNVTWATGTPQPDVLRYAFSDYPNMKLYNSYGLPAQPFTLAIN